VGRRGDQVSDLVRWIRPRRREAHHDRARGDHALKGCRIREIRTDTDGSELAREVADRGRIAARDRDLGPLPDERTRQPGARVAASDDEPGPGHATSLRSRGRAGYDHYVRLAVIGVLAACATPAPLVADAPNEARSDQERRYTIWLGGAQVGTAEETETWSRSGLVLRRVETLRFLRGDAPIEIATTIEIRADHALTASRVTWTENAGSVRHAMAVRDARGWAVTLDGAQLALPGDAVPAELIPLVVRRDAKFAGSVFLPARGFVLGHGRIDPVAPMRFVARLALDAGVVVEATIDLADDGAPARVVDGEGVIAMRATPAQARLSYPLVDLIAATSIPLTGGNPSRSISGPVTGRHSNRIALDGDLALPAVPGQRAHLATGGLSLELSAKLPGGLPPGPDGTDRSRDIRAVVASVQSRIVPDLGARIATARDAGSATAGDCTTYALAYAAIAQRLAIPTRVVTGLRVDGERLVRHRWAVSWTGSTWIAVDAAFGAVPAGGDLIGLAVHDADDAGLIAGEAALMQVRAASWLP
jgi:transglutaminase-like putative cysteine protease